MPATTRQPLWRFASGDTHLYPGTRLRLLEPAGAKRRAKAGDPVLIEFADLRAGHGTVQSVAGDSIDVTMDAHTTAAGTTIRAKVWTLAWDKDRDESVIAKVKGRSRPPE